MNITKEEIQKFLKDSVEWLENQEEGCTTLKLDDRLAVCVGWLPGYGNETRDDVIQASDNPDWGINAGIKVWTIDDMRTDYEFINSPYYDNGEVVETDTSLDPSDKDNDFDGVADYLLKTYEGLYDLNIEEDGRVIEDASKDESLEEKKEVVEEKKEESCESCNKKSIKENYGGDVVIDDLIDRAQSMYDEGNYGDIEDCVRQAIDDGLIYSDDIQALAQHYGTMPDDSELIEGFYDELFSDVYNGIEEKDEDEYDEFEDEEETQEESLHEAVEGLSLENPQFVDWKDYYLNQVCGGDVDEYNELYADGVEDFGDEVCQAIYDLNLNGKKVGEIGAYLFDGMGLWYEIGLTNLDDEVESILDDESLEIQETDLGGYGWIPDDELMQGDYFKLLSTDEEFRKFLQPYVDKLAKLLVKSKDESNSNFEKTEEIKDSIKDVNIFKQGVDDLDDYQLLQKFRDAKNKYLTLKARHGGDSYPTKDMKRRVDKLKKKLLKRGITKESLRRIDTMNEKQILEMLNSIKPSSKKINEEVNDKYFDSEKMTLGDIRTAPIGWTWSCDGMEIAKVDANTLKSPEWGDDGYGIEDYIDDMLAEFDEDTTLDEIGVSELYLTYGDELEYYTNSAPLTPEEEDEIEKRNKGFEEERKANLLKTAKVFNKDLKSVLKDVEDYLGFKYDTFQVIDLGDDEVEAYLYKDNSKKFDGDWKYPSKKFPDVNYYKFEDKLNSKYGLLDTPIELEQEVGGIDAAFILGMHMIDSKLANYEPLRTPQSIEKLFQ